MILASVQQSHAAKNTVMHALYAHYYLGIKRQDIARLFHKSTSTVTNWIKRFEETGDHERAITTHDRNFSKAEQDWVLHHYEVNPMSFLDEAKHEFEVHFKKSIAISTIWRIIHKQGLT